MSSLIHRPKVLLSLFPTTAQEFLGRFEGDKVFDDAVVNVSQPTSDTVCRSKRSADETSPLDLQDGTMVEMIEAVDAGSTKNRGS